MNVRRLFGLAIIGLLLTSLFFTVFTLQVHGDSGYQVTYNPYAAVDWNTWFKVKTQLHDHTTQSDGSLPPDQVIDRYNAAGFGGLGISDHDIMTTALTWPWTTWGRDPTTLGMIDVPNEELTNYLHELSPFLSTWIAPSQYTDTQGEIDRTLERGGVPILAHPSWHFASGATYADYMSLTGFQAIEIFNSAATGGSLVNSNFVLWDMLLTDPNRAEHVWGTASDDSHSPTEIDKGWITVYTPQKTRDSLKASIEAGSFLAVRPNEAAITSITQVGTQLTVTTTESVVWKANGLVTVGTANTLNLDELAPGYTYVRAEVGSGPTFTQPIFIQSPPAPPSASKALSFNGVSNYVKVPHTSLLAPTSQVSFEAWAFRSDWAGYTTDSCILSKTETGGYNIALNNQYLDLGGYLDVQVFRNNVYGIAKVSLSLLSPGWHHFVGIYDGRYLRLYFDGVLLDTNDAGANYPIQYSYNNALMIGAEASSGDSPDGYYFSGVVDEVRVYNRVLTDAEVSGHYAGGAGEYGYPESGLIGGWHFDEGTGTVANDYSGNSNQGTIYGATWVAGKINVPPHGPVASFTWSPSTPIVAASVTFDASSSQPGWDGTDFTPITEYAWTFGDGGTTTGQIVTHAYASSCTYLVTLQVTDSGAQQDTRQKQIQVVSAFALSFDGVNDYVKVPYTAVLTPTSQVSFEVWAYRSDWAGYTTYGSILSKTQSGGYQMSVNNPDWGTDQLVVLAYRNGVYGAAKYSRSLLSGGWHHFVGAYDGRYLRLYVDGVLRNTDDAGATYPITYSSNNALLVGAEVGGADTPDGFYFSGVVDEVRVYSRALADAEVLAHYGGGNGQYGYPESGLVGGWHFDEGTGTVVNDYSGNSNQGTVYGATWVPGKVTLEPHGPTADFTWSPSLIVSGQSVAFDASSSQPGWDGTVTQPIVEYRWDFGDGNTATGQITTHAYAGSGAFTVQLDVKDSQDLSDTDQKQVDVASGSALSFNGVDNYVKVPHTAVLAPTSQIAFEAWAYRSDWAGYTADSHILSKTESGGYTIAVNNQYLSLVGYAAVSVFRNGVYGAAKYPLSSLSGGWHHFAGTYDGRYLRFYVDGVLRDSNDAGGSYALDYSYPNALIIGREAGPADTPEPGYAFSGVVDEVRVYSRALADAEVLAHYGGGNGQYGYPESGLVGGWHFDEGTGTVVNDYSGYNNQGTIYGATWVAGKVNVPPHGPVASFTWSPSLIVSGQSVAFDASSSQPGWDGTVTQPIVEYRWDFGDGNTATGQIATHTYASSGTFTVTLNVTDSQGQWNVKQAQLQVAWPWALSFDGVDDYVKVPYTSLLAPTSQISFEAWAYRSDWIGYSTETRILSKTESGGYQIGVNTAGGMEGYVGLLLYRSGPGYAWLKYSRSLLSGGWHHFVGTYDGRYTRFYVDGVLRDTNDAGGTYAIGYSYGNALTIGREADVGDTPNSAIAAFSGVIDEVRVYSRALTGTEIATQYADGVGQYGDPETGLVGGWHFDEGTGTVVNDYSGYNNQGTIYGATWTGGKIAPQIHAAPAPTAWALSFNGVDNYVKVPYVSALAPTSQITFETWAYRSDWAGYTAFVDLLSKTESGGYTMDLNHPSYPNQLLILVYRNGAYGAATYSRSLLSTGWHHFAGTYDGRYLKLYVDGVLRATDDAGGTYAIGYTNPNALIIGGEAGPLDVPQSGQYFSGVIDEVHIYDRALTGAEISAHYANGNGLYGLTETGLVGGWHFDDGQGSAAYDYSGSKNPGIIYGATWVAGKVAPPSPPSPITTSTGTGSASFILSSWTPHVGVIQALTAVNEADLPTAGKPSLAFPHGFFSFNIIGLTPGQTVTITITLPSNMLVSTQYWKCQSGIWKQLAIGSDDGDNVIVIPLTDGGPEDADGTANGIIVDPGGPGSPAVSISVSSTLVGAGFVKVDGTTITTPQTFTWAIGSTHNLEALSPIVVPTDAQYVWTAWSDGGAQTHAYTVTSSTQTITAQYTRVVPALGTGSTSKTCRKHDETFSLAVTVSNEYSLTGFEFEIHYDTTLLDCVSVTWNAWGSGTVNIDEANGIITGTTSGAVISGTQTLMTIQLSAAYHHMWKDESKIPGWKNDQTGSILFQSASLSYVGGGALYYVKGGVNEISVGSDVAYTFSPIQGDVDNSGSVDVLDLRTVAGFYDLVNSTYDLNGNGIIEIFDLVIVASNFGYTYNP